MQRLALDALFQFLLVGNGERISSEGDRLFSETEFPAFGQITKAFEAASQGKF